MERVSYVWGLWRRIINQIHVNDVVKWHEGKVQGKAGCVAGYWLPRPPDEDVLVDEAELWLVEVGAGVEAGVGADHGQAGAARARVLRQAHLNQGGKCFPEFLNFLLTMTIC